MKHSKTLKIISLCASAMFLLSGCSLFGKNDSEKAAEAEAKKTTVQMQQNDYMGGVLRTRALKDHVLSIMENMKSNNIIIRNDSPNSYWTTNGYQDFVSTFMTNPISCAKGSISSKDLHTCPMRCGCSASGGSLLE